jgi:hypothetical protein
MLSCIYCCINLLLLLLAVLLHNASTTNFCSADFKFCDKMSEGPSIMYAILFVHVTPIFMSTRKMTGEIRYSLNTCFNGSATISEYCYFPLSHGLSVFFIRTGPSYSGVLGSLRNINWLCKMFSLYVMSYWYARQLRHPSVKWQCHMIVLSSSEQVTYPFKPCVVTGFILPPPNEESIRLTFLRTDAMMSAGIWGTARTHDNVMSRPHVCLYVR